MSENKLTKENDKDFRDLGAEAIWKEVYGQPLTTKKNLLEYMEILRQFSKQALDENQLQESYIFIEEHIQKMSKQVKANTLVFLKKELEAKLGKFKKEKKKTEDYFLEFFSQTYPQNKRTREYTFVLADKNRISDTQVLETLKRVNTFCLKGKLTKEQKEDIFPMIERMVDTQSLGFINQLKSMEGLRKAFGFRIVEDHEMFHIKKTNKKRATS
ncbi:hypothetical protein CS063_00865 [Sporanaerobium hydrogeniformans]|uniref:Uncharacterized protein n=1 Tax=Sporanaerobium hydrogeniformans TaxID=3072179 RepID=A0AC61DJJ3_9FIRM|nr:hypothetical protein [Sporanaerobium hydrogeniformans]PHV72062.1 hypothetical protein CS063_00865 [Sporanaerobium hydrogeniformans]